MPNMGKSFFYFRHSSNPGVSSFKMVGVNCGLIPDRPSEPARWAHCVCVNETPDCVGVWLCYFCCLR